MSMTGEEISAAWSEFGRERCGQPKGWRWVSIEALTDDATRRMNKLTGGIFETVFKSGPRKGRTNFGKPKAGKQTIYFTDDEFRDWCKVRGLKP